MCRCKWCDYSHDVESIYNSSISSAEISRPREMIPLDKDGLDFICEVCYNAEHFIFEESPFKNIREDEELWENY